MRDTQHHHAGLLRRRTRLAALLGLALATAAGCTGDVGDVSGQASPVSADSAPARPMDAPIQTIDGGDFVPVHIEVAPGHASAIRGLGARIRSVIPGGYMTAVVPRSQLSALRGLPGVQRVAVGRRVRLYNDLGNLAEGNRSRASAAEAAPPYASANGNGAGSVVCVVDTGIDIHHPDFIEPDGSTRVIGYWDQSDYTDTNAPSEFGYGREYSQADLQAALDGAGSIGSTARDTHGHGSHVAGTIAGNGRAGDATDPDYGAHYGDHQFTGVAPQADILVVQFDFDGSRNTDTAIVEAADWCFRRGAGRAVAVNMSLGGDLGPHDGTTLEDAELNNLTGPGRVIFAAAGNAGELGTTSVHPHTHLPPAAPMHGSGDLASGGSSTITFEATLNSLGRNGGRSNDYFFFDIWYDAGVVVDVTAVAPNGNVVTSANWRTGGAGGGYRSRCGAVFVYNQPGGAHAIDWGSSSGDNEVYIEVSDAASARDVCEGTWTFTLTTVSGTGSYESWHAMSDNFRGSAVSFDGVASDNRMTVGSPAVAANVLAIGAYSTRGDCAGTGNENVWWTDATTWDCYDQISFPSPLGDLAFFSSRGPDRNGNLLPDVAAPGVGIISVRSQDSALGAVAGGMYANMQGTSMSTPNATGVGALAFARNPSLDPAAMRAAMQGSARVDGFVTSSAFASDVTGAAPNNDWGAGKLDVPGLLGLVGCTSAADCDDGDACTTDACDAGSCTHAAVSCADDGDACTVEVCDPATGVCGSEPLSCDDGNPCTDDSCDPASGCAHADNADPCNDGLDCTHSDACAGGSCSGTAYACDDSSACTTDRCNGDGTCTFSAVSCDDGNECTADSCDAATGCAHENLCVCADPGASCTDDAECCSGHCTGRPGYRTCH